MSEETERNKQAVREFFDALNRGDMEAVVNSYAEDGCVHTMGNTLISGVNTKADIRAFGGGVLEAFPEGLTFTIRGMTAEDDRVAVQAESQGQHVSGKPYHNFYHFLFRYRDGELVSLHEYMDTEQVTDVLCGGQRPAAGGAL
ncbi:MAG: nuclear transport factor 2 family protein [Halieaceae bacterium]|nr:nuclear transport factor 2 family protein [Halieaceae bacterium]